MSRFPSLRSEAIPRRVVVVNALALTQLGIGFVGSILVARWAIGRLGLGGFGDFAFLLGFAAVFALSDLGIIPGLTAEVGGRLRAGRRHAASRLIYTAGMATVAFWLALAVASIGFLRVAFPDVAPALIWPLATFAISSGIVSAADVLATLLRVDGNLEYTYASRIAYQIAWIGGVGILYWLFPHWNGVIFLTAAQLCAAVIYAVLIARGLVQRKGAVIPRRRLWCAVTRSRAWRRAWRLSGPERGVRILGAMLTLGERSFLMALGAGAVLGSYDLLLRIAAIISAVPAALAQPLLSMLASDAKRSDGGQAYGNAHRYTMRVTAWLALPGLVAATLVWTLFAEALFGVTPELPLPLALCVFIAAAVNVQTASGVAVATINGTTGIIGRKVYLEAAGVVVAAIIGYLAGSALWFLAIRYAANASAAGLFLWQFRRLQSQQINDCVTRTVV